MVQVPRTRRKGLSPSYLSRECYQIETSARAVLPRALGVRTQDDVVSIPPDHLAPDASRAMISSEVRTLRDFSLINC